MLLGGMNISNSPSRPSHTSPSSSIRVEVSRIDKCFGDGQVLSDVSLCVEPGSMVALLGPSGCGKTTLLRIIAGLESPDAGKVRIGEEVITGPGINVAPERRRVGMVFQNWALFPHMSVERNVAYGLPRRERKSGRVERALKMVGLTGLAGRMPGTLSGGQQQRVALARAIAPEPAVLLLDEPFSNLDTSLRFRIRTEVHQLLLDLGITTLFVTHDQEEAFVLGDEVAVMHGGNIVQKATPSEIYAAPASPWIAGFIGDANLISGSANGPTAATAIGPVDLARDWEGKVDVLLRPEEVALEPANGSTTTAVVDLVEFYGHDTVYVIQLDGGAQVRSRSGSTPRFSRGDEVRVRYAGPPAVAYPLVKPS